MEVISQLKPLSDVRGILDTRELPSAEFSALWDAVMVPAERKDRLLAQAILNVTLRHQLDRASVPMHGVIVLTGPPGTGKTSLARGLACAAIASESMRTDPLVFRSRDLTIRFYCLHGEEAIMNPAYDAHEFAFRPTDHPWQLSIPCTSSDVGWLNRALAAISENVLFRTEGSAPKFGRHIQPPEGPGVAPRRGLAGILKMGAFFRS